MSRIQKLIIAISITLAVIAAGITWFNKGSPAAYQSVKVQPQYYMPPDIQPNCVNEFGCNIKTRIPLWLQKHLTEVEVETQSQNQVVIVKTNMAVLKSLAHGLFIGLLFYGILYGANLMIRLIIKHRRAIIDYFRSQLEWARV